MRLIACFIPLLLLCNCDPNVELENITAENLISISCFISPQDSVLTAYLYNASPMGSTIKPDSAAVKDAQVTISDGQNYDTLVLTYEVDSSTNRRFYKYTGTPKHLRILADSPYWLDVKTSTGIHATAFCTIPPALGSVTIDGHRVDDDYAFSATWTNPSLHKYFLLVLDATGSYVNPYGGRIDLKPSLVEEIIFPDNHQVLSNHYDGIVPYAFDADTAFLRISVKNVDQSLYEYFRSYRQYENWDAQNSGSIFPNFKDVPLIYSNIDGGVGIFGGFNSSSTMIQIQ